MVFELDDTPQPPALSGIDTLVVAQPDIAAPDLVTEAELARVKLIRDEFISHADGFVVNSPETLEQAGRMIDECIAAKKAVSGKLEGVKKFFHGLHRKYSGMESDINGPIEVIEKALRDRSAKYRAKVAEDEAKARREAAAAAEAAAKAKRSAEEEAARQAAADARLAAEQAATNAAAAADAGDIDAAMDAEEEAARAARIAADKAIEAAAVAAAPLEVIHHAPAPSVLGARAGGGSLQYKWIAEPEDTDESAVLAAQGDVEGAASMAHAAAVRAIAAALPHRPDLVSLLLLDISAANKMAERLKAECRIPGMKITKKPVERRAGARGR